MEGTEPDEGQLLGVSVEEEQPAPAPEQSVLSGSEALQPETEGRHRVAGLCNCRWLLEMDSASFNSALKKMFIIILVATPMNLLAYPLVSHSSYYPVVVFRIWHFFLFIFSLNGSVTVCVVMMLALFGLCVDVERPGLRLRLVSVRLDRLFSWTHYKLRLFYNWASTELLPHHKAALRRTLKDALDWIRK